MSTYSTTEADDDRILFTLVYLSTQAGHHDDSVVTLIDSVPYFLLLLVYIRNLLPLVYHASDQLYTFPDHFLRQPAPAKTHKSTVRREMIQSP